MCRNGDDCILLRALHFLNPRLAGTVLYSKVFRPPSQARGITGWYLGVAEGLVQRSPHLVAVVRFLLLG